MRIMWITNQMIGALAQKYSRVIATGQWMNAELEKEKLLRENEVIVCTTTDKKEILVDGNIKHITLPHGNIMKYSVNEETVADWLELIHEEKPDALIIWGTECAIGLAALKANQQMRDPVPSAIYIQGVMKSIYENYRGGFSDQEIRRFTTIVEKIRHTTVFDIENQHKRSFRLEEEVVRLADYIIVENQWAEKIYRQINPQIKVMKNRLPIRKTFFEHSWNEHGMIRHQIITSAAGYPLKGLHQLINALSIVKEKYPDVQLVVPGANSFFVKGIKAKICQHGFNKYVRKLIMTNQLKENIQFVGSLTSEQYAEKMAQSEVFVCASAIENHSSTLREAMCIGVPCVSTSVGGIPEFTENSHNSLLYSFGDYQKLAKYICSIFEDGELRSKLSKNGRETIRRMYLEDTMLSMQNIYSKMIDERDKYENSND